MIIKYWFALIILIVICRLEYAQTYETLEQKSADILLLLSSKDSSVYGSIEKLGEFFDKIFLLAKFDSSNLNQYETYLSLKDSFEEFYLLHKDISFDSALVLFNHCYLKLSNYYYEQAVKKFFSSPKTKILLFSTSMSCHCTLEMCKNQLIDIIKLVRASNCEYDYLVIDAYEKDELPFKYETLFTPSVIVFNGNNEVIHKIQYDEEMIIQLSDFLTIKSNN